jgi:hypothetical protein
MASINFLMLLSKARAKVLLHNHNFGDIEKATFSAKTRVFNIVYTILKNLSWDHLLRYQLAPFPLPRRILKVSFPKIMFFIFHAAASLHP